MQEKVFIHSLCFVVLIIPFFGIAQDSTKTKSSRSNSQPGKHSLHGTIKTKGSGEIIIGATVSVIGNSTGTISNEYGFYSLTLPQNDYTIEVSAAGMRAQQIEVSLNKDVKLDISLEEEVTTLEEVTVKGASTGR